MISLVRNRTALLSPTHTVHPSKPALSVDGPSKLSFAASPISKRQIFQTYCVTESQKGQKMRGQKTLTIKKYLVKPMLRGTQTRMGLNIGS